VRLRHDGARVAFTAGGKTLVSAGRDASVGFWDVPTGRPARRTRLQLPKVPPTRPGASVEGLSPDGKVVVVFGEESVYLHDSATGKELRRLPAGGIGYYHTAFSADGKLLATMVGAGQR